MKRSVLPQRDPPDVIIDYTSLPGNFQHIRNKYLIFRIIFQLDKPAHFAKISHVIGRNASPYCAEQRIRKKLDLKDRIKTIHGVGYIFNGEETEK